VGKRGGSALKAPLFGEEATLLHRETLVQRAFPTEEEPFIPVVIPMLCRK